MRSRQRVRALLDREPVDRIPNGLGGCETAGLHCIAYDRLKKVLKVDDPRTRICTFMTNAIFEPQVIDAMDGDMILLGSQMCSSRFWGPRAAAEWKPLDLWNIGLHAARDWDFRQDPDGNWWWGGCVCPPGSLYFETPVRQDANEMYADHDAPSPRDYHPPQELPEGLLRRLEEDAKWLHEYTEYAIVCGEMIHDLQYKPGGMQAWWIRMVEEPEACHEFLAKSVDAALSQLRQLDQAIGKYCMIVGIADDMGDARGIMVGPDLWRRIYKPHYKRLFTEWHRITKMKVNLHTCGAMCAILEDLAECGVDIYNPVQLSAKGMDPRELKREFGNKLIFYGGAYDSIKTPAETPAETVYEHACANIRALSENGGYIFAGVHNLPGNVPEAHLEALLCAYRDCREYAARP